jgi:hypothetical protein
LGFAGSNDETSLQNNNVFKLESINKKQLHNRTITIIAEDFIPLSQKSSALFFLSNEEWQ